MPVVRQAAGKLSLDLGPSAGEHLWVAKGCVLQDGGYEKLPEWASVQTQGVGVGHLPRGAHCWRGGYTGRIYAASDSKFFEVADSSITDVTGTTPDNATNGVKFASYGEWCFAANGVDKIQTIKVPSTLGAAANFEDMVYTTGGAKIAPKYICSHKNHIVAADIKFTESYGEIASYTTAVGAAFTNQPTNDSIQINSSVAGEIAPKAVTVWGTRTGQGDTVYAEVITLDAVNGTTYKTSTTTDWNKILGTNCDFAPGGTITIRKTTGAANITTFTTAVGSGIASVPAASQAGGDRVLDIVASAATTKQVGFFGTTPGGTVTWDSQALNGTTTVQSNNEFRSFTNVLIGDIENTVTVTVTSHQYPAGFTDPYLVWWSGTDDPEGYGTEVLAPQIVGSSNQPLLDGTGKVTGVVDGGDCFFVFKEGCIYRFDGPPFQPTIINYSVGMDSGLLPYRQGDRVYFWSNSGLSYINILDNSVTPTMGGYVQRSVIDFANGSYGLASGSFPVQRVSTIQLSNAVKTQNSVSISGDPENGLVMVFYRNASAAGTNGFVYNEKRDSFTQLYEEQFNTVVPNLVDYRIVSGQIPGMLSYIRSWNYVSSTVIAFKKLSVVGLPAATSDDVYMRWPFFGAPPGGPTTRIARVRPIFDNPASTVTQAIDIHCMVVSLSGTGKNWKSHGVPSVGRGTTSLDGWITIDGCPYAERHSVGVSFTGGAGAASPNPSVANLVGIDVDIVTGGRKGI